MWTPSALVSEARPYSGDIWRVVEAQHRVATMRLTDTLDEQRLLEELIDEVKPQVPGSCRHLDWLLSTPFRYAPYPNGSRFRRAGQREGAFYASETVGTALAEMAFHRLLFFLNAPDAAAPANAADLTAFSARVQAARAIDLTVAPFNARSADWERPADYAATQALADAARTAGVGAIRSRSVRDPHGGVNVAVLDPAGFARPAPLARQTWRMLLRRERVRVWSDLPAGTPI